MIKSTLAIMCLTFMIACGPDPDTQLNKVVPVNNESDITVTRVGVFPDDLAFDGKRGIYIIHDRKTGQDYIGISGVGISERGQHMAGKVSVQDER